MTLSLQHCLLRLYLLSLWILLVTYGNELPNPSRDGLPFCGIAESSSRYIFVSTLDGRLTALNPNNGGSVLWSVHPGSESLLSSSIHNLELSNYGNFVRMIPSLSGGLYKFNGENIEVIPVTADHLLHSSFRYSDDLVISGGKEAKTFGVSLKSGNVIYECSMKGCGNVSQATDGGEILVIQRLGQIVRAVEPRTGTEKWNFSVAQHDLKLLSDDCHQVQKTELNYKLKVIVPDGMICAVDSRDESKIIWKQKFNSPVVNAWQFHRGKLIEVDLFNGYQPPGLNLPISPSIYVGMHDKQLYIQESVLMLKKREEISSKVKQKLIGTERNYPRIPWKPIPASSTALDVIRQEPLNSEETSQTTALSVLYASPYVNGNGFYLYSNEEFEKTTEFSNTSSENFNEDENNYDLDTYLESQDDYISDFPDDFSEVNTSVEIVIVSFWYYWKEVLVISLTTAFLCNLMITRVYLRWKVKSLSKISENEQLSSPMKESDSNVNATFDHLSKIVDNGQVEEYISRYLTDFSPVACLGKGGFGVVFEAKNKIDECHYAIKRILLPNTDESRDRVMREVKALAKLDHHHIVRYFNAWTECPPPGWQDNYDKSWVKMHSDLISSYEMTSAPYTNINSEINSASSYFNESTHFSHNGINNFKGNSEEISDSFIVFEGSSQNDCQKILSDDKENSRFEGVDVFNFEAKKSKFQFTEKVLTKSDRPTSLTFDQKSNETQCLNKVYLYIQMQLCQRESLKDWLINNSKRDYDTVLNIFEQILQAVHYVHLHGLIHRDLKPSNIFFSLDNKIKVGDFGLVTAMTEGKAQSSPTYDIPVSLENKKHTGQVGTQLYMSREQLLGKPYNYKVDIYSLGLILFELLVPFSTQMERIRVLQDIKNDNFPKFFKEKYKKEHDLLKLMLSHSPDKRPTTYGVRARLPLKQEPTEEDWHFELPVRRRTLSKTSQDSVSSSEGSFELK